MIPPSLFSWDNFQLFNFHISPSKGGDISTLRIIFLLMNTINTCIHTYIRSIHSAAVGCEPFTVGPVARKKFAEKNSPQDLPEISWLYTIPPYHHTTSIINNKYSLLYCM